ncbi:hypothetical protein [Frondihabitans cladoniiphilus]|uniref:Uncharacterized protein n=1 Tax=Frondihabitans cladoniiphilus TaxID=715785 RepID=A0ABP8WE06_9MICO
MSDGAIGLTASADDDPQVLLDSLAEGVTRALPASVVREVLDVTRNRSLGDRMAGRPGRAESLRITREGRSMTLSLERGGRLVTEVARVAGGIIISRKTPPLGEWLELFAGEIGAIAADAAGDAATAARALTVLGVRPAGSDLAVDESDIGASILTLPSRLRGRIPDEALTRVERIVALVHETLPRVTGGGEAEVVVERTATAYLPDTLRAYLALPADWATSHVLSNGRTSADTLVAQLDDLETAATRMRDAAVEQDASALLVNGRFLADRFATGLELQ